MAKRIKSNGKPSIRERLHLFDKNMADLDDKFLKLLIRLNMKRDKPPVIIRDNGADKKNEEFFQI